ncbi:DEDD exonuclease domain-containing protein [Rubrivirga sp. IMCC45206]|uniref:DEDD exonuclease domain-containing protein n=1 Tax=Rubrivirga sp. IMCC45206 TaxID=3391614 RepID=UPI00399015DB
MDVDTTPFVIVDTETTGSRAGDDRIIEIGAARLVGGEIVDTFQQLIDPGRHVPQRITRLTGISTAMVYGQPDAAEVMPQFVDFLGDSVLVAHNLPFDARFLDVALAESGLPPLQNQSLDTLRLARRLLSSLPSKGLSKLTQHFGIKVNGRHRALGDAVATAELLVILLERLRIEFNVTTVEGVLGFQRRRYKDTRREPAHLKKIREQTLPLLPDRPGVYFMRDSRGSVIYVGKAKSLRNRVRSYFTGVENHDPKTRKLIRDVREVTWRETGTELSALLEESKLIKNYLPVYNRAQRRYRDYPFIRLDTRHRTPTISWTPRIAHDGAEYYGPLGRRGQAEELVELIGRLFLLRECDDNVFALGRPCLYHEMGRCGAPCVGGDGADQYDLEVQRVRAFLTGQDTEAIDLVEEAMREAAASREYEAAGWYRDQLRRLQRTLGRQKTVASAVHEHHAVLVEPLAPGYDGLPGGAQLFLIRHGRLAATVDLPADPGPDEVADLRAALAEAFDPDLPAPDVHRRPDVDEMRMLASWMRLNGDAARTVRWDEDTDTDDLVAAVLASARAASPTSEPVVEETEG